MSLLGWKSDSVSTEIPATNLLTQKAIAYVDDVIATTRACDLEHRKVKNVVRCHYIALNDLQSEVHVSFYSVQDISGLDTGRELAENVRLKDSCAEN